MTPSRTVDTAWKTVERFGGTVLGTGPTAGMFDAMQVYKESEPV